MQKNVEELKVTNPGKAFKTLKQMGALPGDCSESNTFNLVNHETEGLSDQQSAERIAEHFAEISNEFPPLSLGLLPDRVKTKLNTKSSPPIIEDFEVYEKIKSAKKPQSGVPGDLPRSVTKEFAPELDKPINKIISNIVQTSQWPSQ